MKVGIITILDNINLGTVLQAYALGHMVERYGHEVEFINYIRSNQTVGFQIRKKLRGQGGLASRIIGAAVSATVVPVVKYRLRKNIFRKFSFSRRYTSVDSLRTNPPSADLYLTGSDQVWNSDYNGGIDPAFFLDFTSGRKCSYGASVGMDKFSENEEKEVVRLLNKYDIITVREKPTSDYLNNLGLKSSHVLDPTLLLDKSEWISAFDLPANRLIEEPYLLVYSVESTKNDFIFEQAKLLAKERGLKLVGMTASNAGPLKKYHPDLIYSFTNADTFLHLMRDAAFVIASSFHGTAFCLNFNKDFITVTPPRFNIRMESIINQFNLRHRIVSDNLIHSIDLLPIDYRQFNNDIIKFRKDSLSHLQNILNKK